MKTALRIALGVLAVVAIWWLLALVVGWLSYALIFVVVLGLIGGLIWLLSPGARARRTTPKTTEKRIERAATRELKDLEKRQQTLGRKSSE
jgi:uncharacterized protein (DUF58 family)